MLRGKQQAVSLPPIQGNYIKIAKLSVSQAKSQTDSALRSKTQPFTSQHKRTLISGSQLFQNICQAQQIQNKELSQENRKQKMEIISKGESISQIIDTRKSIKMLLEYFDSKSQEQRNKNMNCYHSPKKQIYQLLPIVNTPDRNVIGRKAINFKKIKLQQKKMPIKTQGNESPVRPKKYRSYLKDVIKIQPLALDSYSNLRKIIFSENIKMQDGQKQKINSFSNSKQTHSVIKIKSKDQILHVQRKVTEFEGWHIENDINYLQ